MLALFETSPSQIPTQAMAARLATNVSAERTERSTGTQG